MAALLVAVLVGLLFTGTKSLVPTAGAVQASSFFDEFCDNDHTLNEDPLKYPGQANASHSHDFYANKATDRNATGALLLSLNTDKTTPSTTTSCHSSSGSTDRANDGSGIWRPTLYDCGIVDPGPAPLPYTLNGPCYPKQDQAVHIYWNGVVQGPGTDVNVAPPTGFAEIMGQTLRGVAAYPNFYEWQCLQDKNNLLRYANVDNNSVRVAMNEIQTVKLSANVTGGTFTLTYNGQTTAGIAYNAPNTGANSVQSRLEDLSNINVGDVAVSSGPLPNQTVKVTFQGALANQDINQMTANGASLLPAGSTVTVDTSQDGQPAGLASQGFKCGKTGQNAVIRFTIHTAQCWKGDANGNQQFDPEELYPSDQSQSHVMLEGTEGDPKDNKCPATFPVHIPQIAPQFDTTLQNQGGIGHFYRVASSPPPGSQTGSTASIHMDWLVAWDPQALAGLVAVCLNGGQPPPLPSDCNVNA